MNWSWSSSHKKISLHSYEHGINTHCGIKSAVENIPQRLHYLLLLNKVLCKLQCTAVLNWFRLFNETKLEPQTSWGSRKLQPDGLKPFLGFVKENIENCQLLQKKDYQSCWECCWSYWDNNIPLPTLSCCQWWCWSVCMSLPLCWCWETKQTE